MCVIHAKWLTVQPKDNWLTESEGRELRLQLSEVSLFQWCILQLWKDWKFYCLVCMCTVIQEHILKIKADWLEFMSHLDNTTCFMFWPTYVNNMVLNSTNIKQQVFHHWESRDSNSCFFWLCLVLLCSASGQRSLHLCRSRYRTCQDVVIVPWPEYEICQTPHLSHLWDESIVGVFFPGSSPPEEKSCSSNSFYIHCYSIWSSSIM